MRNIIMAAFAALYLIGLVPDANAQVPAGWVRFHCPEPGGKRVSYSTPNDCTCPKMPAMGQSCADLKIPKGSSHQQLASTPMAPQADVGGNAGSTTSPALSGGTFTAGQLNELVQQTVRDGQVKSQVASAPTASAGGCWTKHPITLAKAKVLVSAGVDDASWKADMCQTPEQFAVNFSQAVGWNRPSSVTEFNGWFSKLKTADCSNAAVKDYVFATSTGQKGAPFGKCGDDDVIWVYGQTEQPVWSETKGGGKALMDKGRIPPK